MSKKKKWIVLNKAKVSDKNPTEEVIKILLENRGITNIEEKENFLHPKLEDVAINSVGIDKEQLEKALARIKEAIEKKEHIVVFGDYDVDGITGTAILWETFYALGANVTPYIPDRIEEGYGLSVAGIENLIAQDKRPDLIVTVDNGIAAHLAVTYANEQGIEVIITDHHTRGETDPEAYAIVHTTKLCGAGVGYLLAKELTMNPLQKKDPSANEGRITDKHDHLDLVALATIADLVPLTGANRTLVKFGLKALRKTKRVGLLALFKEAGIDSENIGVYEIGHIIGPRLNAMGRMASAIDSLRLICTKDRVRAQVLADTLGRTNKERQVLTQEMTSHALESFQLQSSLKNLLFISDETYEQGVIGLVASKLVETYYRPAIVLSKGEKLSKASARSISGFNIIEFIRNSSHLLVNAGGHPMAAGFTVETEKLIELQETMELMAQEQITDDILIRNLKIDCELPLEIITQHLYEKIQTLSPFGMANSEPTFISKKVIVQNIRAIGQAGKHLKLKVSSSPHPNFDSGSSFDAIAFNMGELIENISIGDEIDVAYIIDENEWNGRKNLQLKVKDIQTI
ncbi:MAG TPA: single-stranded-DNA-specific exonuclease RecJ [Candidatus Saccharimonadales bacterium]|nr:single-stranded-DNA-specific exonuclease RecJ [Candidatus Saccharimonadales bacterium]